MTDWREELVEKMADGMFASDENGTLRVDVMARAALEVAEPVIREQADNALREENARLREALKELIEDHEYMTDTDAEEDNLARAHARAAIREGGKDE